MTSFLLTVHQGKEKHVLELAAGSSVGDVQRALNVTAGVLPADQRLLFKGKEPNSASLLADLGVKAKDKMMLLLSKGFHEGAASRAVEEKRRTDRAAAKEALEAVTGGGGTAGAAVADAPQSPLGHLEAPETATAITTASPTAAAAAPANAAGTPFWVEVVQGKTKIRCELGAGVGPDVGTVADIKGLAARALGVPVSGVKLLGKGGCAPADGATLTEAKLGRRGARLLAMLTRSGHAELEAQAATGTLAEQLETAEVAVRGVLSAVRHRFITHTELTFKVAELDDAVSRALDAVEHMHVDSVAAQKQELSARVEVLQRDMREIRRFHMEGVHSSS